MEADLLYEAASVWRELMQYHYIFSYGYKQKKTTITLRFACEHFPHVAGFQCFKERVSSCEKIY